MAGTLKCMVQSSANPVSGVTAYKLDTGVTLTVDTTLGNCDSLDIRGIRSLAVKPVSGGAAITTLTFYGCDTSGGTFVIIDSIGSSGVLTVVDSKWNVVDITKIGPNGFIKMVPSANGTATVMAKN